MKNKSLGKIVYRTDSTNGSNDSIFCDERFYAPECGSVFSARVCKENGKRDYTIDRIKNYTGYIKKNFENPNLKVVPGKFYRFLVISPPHTKNYHNFFQVVPLRKLGEREDVKLNLINPSTNIFLRRLGEFMLGLRFDRDTKKLEELKEYQKEWDWLFKNFLM